MPSTSKAQRKMMQAAAHNPAFAMNLKNNAASSAVSACGEEGSGLDRKIKAKPASAKQEVEV